MAENRIDQAGDHDPIDDAIWLLHRSGWSIDDIASRDGAAGYVRFADGNLD